MPNGLSPADQMSWQIGRTAEASGQLELKIKLLWTLLDQQGWGSQTSRPKLVKQVIKECRSALDSEPAVKRIPEGHRVAIREALSDAKGVLNLRNDALHSVRISLGDEQFMVDEGPGDFKTADVRTVAVDELGGVELRIWESWGRIVGCHAALGTLQFTEQGLASIRSSENMLNVRPRV